MTLFKLEMKKEQAECRNKPRRMGSIWIHSGHQKLEKGVQRWCVDLGRDAWGTRREQEGGDIKVALMRVHQAQTQASQGFLSFFLNTYYKAVWGGVYSLGVQEVACTFIMENSFLLVSLRPSKYQLRSALFLPKHWHT